MPWGIDYYLLKSPHKNHCIGWYRAIATSAVRPEIKANINCLGKSAGKKIQETIPMTNQPCSRHSPIPSAPDRVHLVHNTTELSLQALSIETTRRVRTSTIGWVLGGQGNNHALQIMSFAPWKPPTKFDSNAAMNAGRRGRSVISRMLPGLTTKIWAFPAHIPRHLAA